MLDNRFRRFELVFKVVFIAGFLTHGYMFFNKISLHDDAGCLYSLGSTVSIGRWGLEVIQQIMLRTVGLYSMPIIEGVVSLFFIALSAFLITELFRINEIIDIILISILLVVFPVSTSIFFYMFTAGSYFFAFFLAVVAVWLMQRNGVIQMGVAILCIAFSLGIYQAFFPITVTLSVLLLIRECHRKESGLVWKKACYFLTSEILGLVLYLILVHVSESMYNVQLGDYQGADSMFKLSLDERVRRIGMCYRDIFRIMYEDVNGLSNSIIIRVCMVISLLIIIYIFVVQFKKLENMTNKILNSLCFLCLPICINLIYPLTNADSYIYILLRYPIVFIFLIPILQKEFVCSRNEGLHNQLFNKGMSFLGGGESRYICIYKVFYLVCGITVLFYAYLDNVSYFKADLQYKQVYSYYTVLVNQIKNCENYSDEYPVVIIGEGPYGENRIEDATLTRNNSHYNLSLPNAWDGELSVWINNYSWKEYLKNYLGYSPQYMGEEDIGKEYDEMIGQMSVYPKDGSIRVYDEKVFVRFH